MIINNDMEEIWLPCLDFEENYLVSNLGRILNKKSNKIISLTKIKGNNNGSYLVAKLTKDKKHFSCKVHRLVAHTFLGKSLLSVNHKNGIKDDNRLVNLEYLNNEEQNTHAEKLGLRPYKSKRPIMLYNNDKIKSFESIKDAVRYINIENKIPIKNIQSNITHVLNGRAKTAYGFSFKYIN